MERLLSIAHEKLALITLGTLFNAISRSEFDDGLAAGATAVAYEVGQRCRLERISNHGNSDSDEDAKSAHSDTAPEMRCFSSAVEVGAAPPY
jgi:hypothetical protein